MRDTEAFPESELYARVRDADPSALEQLYDHYAGFAMAVAFKIVGNREEAEDVVQDVFWRLWTSKIEYDPTRGRFKTWLFGICRNRAIDLLRKRARRPQSDPSFAPEDLFAPSHSDELVITKQRSARVQDALSSLPLAQRTVIELSFYRGLTHREIAKETGEAVGTVKSRIHGGMAKLRGSLIAAGVAS